MRLVEGHGAVEYTPDDPGSKESPLGSQTPQNRGLRQPADISWQGRRTMSDMSLRTLVFMSGALMFAFISSLLLYMMIGQVNRKLPDSEQIPYLFMYPGKVARIKQQHRKFYPESRVNVVRVVCNFLTILFAIALACTYGIFHFR